MNYEPVTVNQTTIGKLLNHKETLLLKYQIKYPQFTSDSEYQQRPLNYINYAIRNIVIALIRKYNEEFYEDALTQYYEAMVNNYPFNNFEAQVDYQITYNDNCIISLYFDRYEYTGGAHGMTIRTSFTWDTRTGRLIELPPYFSDLTGYKEWIVAFVCDQVEKERSEGENIYFDDYCSLAEKNFNPRSYYLSPEGIVIYYQQYDIAPYASGIREFTIPYSTAPVKIPSCSVRKIEYGLV